MFVILIMLKFNRRKTRSKSDENVCSWNGCVGGRNGEQVWPIGDTATCIEGSTPVDTAYEDGVSELRTQTSACSVPCIDAEVKTRRTKPFSVLHVLRDKLKSSKSRSLQSAECLSPLDNCGSQATQEGFSLINHVNRSEYDIIGECCGQVHSDDQCDCDTSNRALPPAENCRSEVRRNSETAESFSSNDVGNCTGQEIDSSSKFSAAVRPPVRGGLVLSQLSNIVSVESRMKSDELALRQKSRLPLSPISNSDSGLDTPDERQPVKWTLANELLRLSRYGWYWGPVSREEAEEKLSGQPEGAFLVRDSTDDRYLFSLSFRSSGRTLHTRVEYCNGEFSFYAQPRSDSYRSMAELIEQCVAESQSGIYCYSRGTSGVGAQSYPVKLTRPVSRFAQVRSLQYLCRFVIRQHTRVDHIQNLPLPVSVKGWLKENQY